MSAEHRQAFAAVTGTGQAPSSGHLIVAQAVLRLLRATAEVGPLLLVVDDLHWLNRPSQGVLALVARRLAESRVGFLAASRSGHPSFFDRVGLTQHEVAGLDLASSQELLDVRFPGLAPSVRQRLLEEAQGNPLALIELAAALSEPQRMMRQPLPSMLPLSGRLHEAIASRVQRLPPATRRLLLLVALDWTGNLRADLFAARARPDDVDPAEEAGLVKVDNRTRQITLAHPLIRSALVELAGDEELRLAHASLAAALDESEHRARHLAAAAVGPDEATALELERAARRTLRQGDGVGAVEILMRAAELTPVPAERRRRLAGAAFIGADVTGQLAHMSMLLTDGGRPDHDSAQSLAAAAAGAYLLLNEDGDVDTSHRLLVSAIEEHRGLGRDRAAGQSDPDDPALIEALHTLLLICFFSGRAEAWLPFHAAVRALGPKAPDTLTLAAATFADPARDGQAALKRLDAAIADLPADLDPTRIVRIGIAAIYVDRVAGCRHGLWRVVQDGRSGGAVASAINATMLLAFDDLVTGRWGEAQELASEGLRLCESHGYLLLSWPGQLALALVAAARGDRVTVMALTDEMTQWAEPRRVQSVQAYAHHALALLALGRGDYETAYQHACAVSPAGVLADHVAHAL